MSLDGGDARKVTKARFWFHTVAPSGAVRALTGMSGDERTGAALCFPPNPEAPRFDPDRCGKREIAPESFEYVLGEWLYRAGGDGGTVRERLSP